MIGKTLLVMAAAMALSTAIKVHYPMNYAYVTSGGGLSMGKIHKARKRNQRNKAQKRRR